MAPKDRVSLPPGAHTPPFSEAGSCVSSFFFQWGESGGHQHEATPLFISCALRAIVIQVSLATPFSLLPLRDIALVGAAPLLRLSRRLLFSPFQNHGELRILLLSNLVQKTLPSPSAGQKKNRFYPSFSSPFSLRHDSESAPSPFFFPIVVQLSAP